MSDPRPQSIPLSIGIRRAGHLLRERRAAPRPYREGHAGRKRPAGLPTIPKPEERRRGKILSPAQKRRFRLCAKFRSHRSVSTRLRIEERRALRIPRFLARATLESRRDAKRRDVKRNEMRRGEARRDETRRGEPCAGGRRRRRLPRRQASPPTRMQRRRVDAASRLVASRSDTTGKRRASERKRAKSYVPVIHSSYVVRNIGTLMR